MEKKIREYEKYIKAQTATKHLSDAERAKLIAYHHEMLANFQHERLIHLLVTLFFAALLIAALIALGLVVVNFGLLVELMPCYLLVLILAILVGFYVKHYYFLENHVQKLYQYTKILME